MIKTIHEMSLEELIAHREKVNENVLREKCIFTQEAYRKVLVCTDTLIKKKKAGK